MAKAAVSTDADSGAPRKGPSLVVQLGVLFALTGAAVGAGWFSGTLLGAVPAGAPAAAESTAPESGHAATDDGHAVGDDDAGEAAPGAPHVVVLEPITTNLASPAEIWARMELAVVFEGSPDEAVAQAIHQDFLAYMRTLRLSQIEGASGFQHLKSDLEERAALRSEGRVKRVLIQTLLFE